MNRYAFAYLGEVETGVAQFDCGEPELNFFLHNEAEHYVKTGLSAVKLLLDRESDRVAGFYAISPHSVKSEHLTREIRELYNVSFSVPAWLIGRLAVDIRYQGIHSGGALLQDALCNIKSRARNGAGAMIIVDAKNKRVKKFYKKYEFSTLASCGGLKLFMFTSCV